MILSIVIPTYNRSNLFQCLLDSIFLDLEKLHLKADIEIIVIDNASTDDTVECIQRRIDSGQLIKLISNPENIGMDRNLAYCFERSSGRYFWQIGDDEILYCGALNWVIDFCRNNEFGLLHIESCGFQLSELSVQKNKSIAEQINAIELNSEEIFRRANVFLTFISANIVNKKMIVERLTHFDSKSELDSFVPQLSWIYGALKLNLKNYYVKSVMFAALSGNTGGYKLVKVFGDNLIRITNEHFPNNKKIFSDVMVNAVLSRLFPSELYSQSRSNKNEFESEETEAAMKKLFSERVFYKIFIIGLFSRYFIIRKMSFGLTLIFNKINKCVNFKLL